MGSVISTSALSIQINERTVMNRQRVWKVVGVALLPCGLAKAGTITTFDATGAAQALARALSLKASTRQGRFREPMLTRSVTCTASCALVTALSPTSTFRARLAPSPGARTRRGRLRGVPGRELCDSRLPARTGRCHHHFDAPGAGTERGQGTVGSSLNPAGTVTGYDIDASGVYHGFLRTP
jgi:hypothetical protein